MPRVARARQLVELTPEAALALWTDTDRWPTFVEGFARVLERSGDWPAEGASVIWESTPEGRGRVTEKVVEHRPGRFATQVYEQALSGIQSLSAGEDAEGALLELALEYELSRYGPLSAAADALFIRRAQRDALGRTLRRFAVEAEEEAGLR
jgi:Polyketide cyclase / dehydrase and lipid transport